MNTGPDLSMNPTHPSSRFKLRPRRQTIGTSGLSISNPRAMDDRTSRTGDSSQWPPRLDNQRETAEDVARKAVSDQEARRTSEKIDLSIAAERSRQKKKKPVKVLLLGQSESGKSTTLRNFQFHLTPQAFQADAEAWRTVIHLNLLMSVNYLLDILKESLLASGNSEERVLYSSMSPSRQLIEREKLRLRSLDAPLDLTRDPAKQRTPVYSSELRRLMLSLLPLKSIEATLRRRLGAEPAISFLLHQAKTTEESGVPEFSATTHPTKSGSSLDAFVRPASAQSSLSQSKSNQLIGPRRHSVSSSATSSTLSLSKGHADAGRFNASIPSTSLLPDSPTRRKQHHRTIGLHDLVGSFAVKVRGSTGWKRRARIPDSLSSGRSNSSLSVEHEPSEYRSGRSSLEAMSEQEERDLLSARKIVEVFGEDIQRLWQNGDLQKLLKHKNIRLESRSGFFLNDVPRITAFDYIPTIADILRARLQTTGVEEHRLLLETGPNAGKEWIIYDVGGFRSQRAAWAPFFDTVNAIIFLAPISSFDEWLAEDPTVNRLEDTFSLWREICSNRLLALVDFILFLNKHDVLRAKLRSGIRFADYVVNYDDQDGRRNDADSISRWMLATFHAVHKRLSPRPRKLRAYLTSVIDSRATAKVVTHVSEQVLIHNLTQSEVL